MAPVKLKEVIVYSSQDAVHRADNLLQEQSSQWKRWLCASGDRSGTMQAEFQLEKAARIGYIDIGNYGSAFVEVLVRKSFWSSNQYITLIPATMLMSPMESRTGQNKCVVKMFSKASLSEESLKEEWDRIKVICSQPYKKDAQFGLAFIRLRSLEEQKQANQSVSPGPTMTKLHSKTESPPSASANRSKSRTVLSPSWKADSSFQRQFVLANDGSNKYGDVDLKSRLLKMASTADAGSDKSDSLSRSAKMVLASANNKESTPKRQTGYHGNDVQSVPLNNRSDARERSHGGSMGQQDRTRSGQRQSYCDIENHESPHRDERNHCIRRHGNKDSFSNISPERSNYLESRSKRHESPGGDRQLKETLQEDARRPAKRPSNSLPETSPTKTKNTDSNTPFKQLAEDLLKSFGHRLVDAKLSDIRPVLERKLKRKLSKQEKKTLKELAVQRVDFLIKTRSSPAPPSASATSSVQPPQKNPQPQPKEKIAKPQTQRCTSSSAVGVPSSSLDDADAMEFRSCHKCYLNFTARQITGHVLTCQGIKSAGSITMAASAFSTEGVSSSPKRGGRRGRGRGRGEGGGRQGRRSSPGVDATPTPLAPSHIRTVQMPSYQGNGAVAKRKGKGKAVNSSSRNSSATKEGIEEKPGGFVMETTGFSPPESPKFSAGEGAVTNTSLVQDVGFTSCPICQESFPSYIIEQHADLCLERNMILTEMANQQVVCV